jgi:phenylpyruvate tautomerase PptA (4-oxalocrotonate tautomerase family)
VRHWLAARIADAAAEVFESRPHGTWVTLRFLDRDAYAESSGGPAIGVEPVLVSVLLAELPDTDTLARRAADLTEAIAHACERPANNVHVIFEPAAAGRISFGGTLKR